MNDTIEWFKDARRITNLSTKIAKMRFAKRLKNVGVELLYGSGDSPVSVSYKNHQRIAPGTRLAELCKLIDKEAWDSVEPTTP